MPAVKSYLLDPEWHDFAKWLDAEREQRRVSRRAIASALNQDTTHVVSEYLDGKRLITPGTLRVIVGAIGIQWPVAIVRGGYYEEILRMLADLWWLGERWCEEDDVYPWGSDRPSFRTLGVCKVSGKRLSEALQDEALGPRYHAGTFTEEVEVVGEIPPELKHYYQDRERKTTSVLPKPMAVAIFVATAGFPRRGDYYKEGAETFAAVLLEVVSPLAMYAFEKRRQQDPSGAKALPRLLGQAKQIFDDDDLSSSFRRIVSAEYVTEWADAMCQAYTHYARLAVYQYWGEGGSSVSTASPYAMMPTIRVAPIPVPSDFAWNGLA